jgi:magnesium-transporting ATPase (P-type)
MTAGKKTEVRSTTSVLGHFFPGDVIRQCNELSRKFEHDEAFKRYVVRKMWLVIPFGFVFTFASFVAAAAPFVLLDHAPSAGFPWTILALVIAAIAWFGSLYVQFFVLLSWLERRFIRRLNSGRNVTGSRKSFWGPIVVFLFLPLLVVAFFAPKVVLFLIALALFAPILLTLWDR